MKFFASFLLVVLAAFAVAQANVQPTPAPRVEKRQSFDPYNLSQYTNPGALSSLSQYINSQFGALDSVSLPASESSYIASQKSQAYSYLSLASSILANGGASNSNLGSILGSITKSASGALSSISKEGSSAASAASSAATSSRGSSNGAVAASGPMPGYMVGVVACTFVAALAGAFAL
ncbi:hypothetical protein PHSY_003795 [Pseudozyma hubeiensis SY62]|uniref:Uncharacterized protein n=1 Tax=Pseudozyma hubeiensis (strain SY62) TaxID=1305764 RepID=R9PDP2_PSEHS|nr:hypothetical protein PHSY_003795 [Pseudozyma hubeiensis SY62]GAC96215.1 hypothetical protein PHSY_003795 [Pseudozyma hubeiensis SY62]